MSEDPASDDSAGAAAAATVVDVDASGLFCPEPVMLLHNKIRDLDAGRRLRIVATDPSTSRDIPKFCLYLGHELLEQGRRDGKYIYLIRKKAADGD